MHVHLLTLGSRGDVQPYVALGASLKARGHEVTLTTGAGFDELIEAHGLVSAPISEDVRALVEDPMVQEALRTFSGKIKAWRELKGGTTRQLDESWSITRQVDPDLIVFHVKMFGAPDFAAALGIPALPSFLIPGLIPTSGYPSPMLPVASLGAFGNRLSNQAILRLARLSFSGLRTKWRRERLGDTATGPKDPFEGYDPTGRPPVRLHAYSAHVVPKPDDWGKREQVTGHWVLDGAPDWKPPETLVRFLDAGPPPVYVGFGSMPAEDAGGMTRLVIEALERSGHRGVLATGWGGMERATAPETVHMLETVPHGWLFPRCAAVVHHGGAGTTHEGLRWGRPTVICPVGVDQPFWGRRIAALGVGPDPIPQKRLVAEYLADALRQTGDPGMRTRAEALGARIRSEGGTETAAELIEGWMDRQST